MKLRTRRGIAVAALSMMVAIAAPSLAGVASAQESEPENLLSQQELLNQWGWEGDDDQYQDGVDPDRARGDRDGRRDRDGRSDGNQAGSGQRDGADAGSHTGYPEPPKKEDPPKEDPPKKDPPKKDPPKEEPVKPEPPKVEDPKVEDPKVEDPKFADPTHELPVTGVRSMAVAGIGLLLIGTGIVAWLLSGRRSVRA